MTPLVEEARGPDGNHDQADSVGEVELGRDLPPGISGPPGWLLKVIRDERVAFLLVGGVNTVVGTVWYWVFWSLLKNTGRWAHIYSLVPTYLAAILCAFFLYRTLVFRVKGHVWRDLLRFSSVYLTTFLINIPLQGLLTDVLGLHPMVSQVINVGITTVMSYVFHKRFSFRRTARDLEEDSKEA